MKEIFKNSKYLLDRIGSESKVISYIKCWFWGSFFSFAIASFFFLLLAIFYPNIIAKICGYHDTYYAYFFSCGPFLGALFLKIYKKNTPAYIYSTTGLIFIIIFYYFLRLCSDADYFLFPIHCGGLKYFLVEFTIANIIASFLGGFIIDIYINLSSPRSLFSNIRYWLMGNFISFTIGFIVTLFISFRDEIPLIIFDFIICVTPFIGSLILKFIKKDIPWCIYSTTGLIFVIIYCYYGDALVYFLWRILSDDFFVVHLFEIKSVTKEALGVYGHIGFHVSYMRDYYYIVTHTMMAIIASSLGGIIADLYGYFKRRYSKTISSSKESQCDDTSDISKDSEMAVCAADDGNNIQKPATASEVKTNN